MNHQTSSSNQTRVLNSIRIHQTTTRSNLAQETGLTVPAISNIVRGLELIKLVKEDGRAESTGGKPAQLVSFDGTNYFVLGVDMGTTNLRFAVMNLKGQVVYKEIIPTPTTDRTLMNILDTRIHQIIADCASRGIIVVGIGIGAPGIVNRATGQLIYSPNMKYAKSEIRTELMRSIDLPIEIHNITKCMALAEQNFDNDDGATDIFCISLGFGIGSALITHSELYEGANNGYTEMGHTLIKPNGPLCACGNHGCVEAVSSISAIIRDAKTAVDRGEETVLKTQTPLTGKKVFDAAIAGDPVAIQVVSNALQYLGIAITNITNLLDPQRIVLLGGMTNSKDYLLEKIVPIVQENHFSVGDIPQIQVSKLGEDAGVIGAASLIMNHIFQSASVDPVDWQLTSPVMLAD